MSLPSYLPKSLMLATAGLQGLGIYLLYRSFDEGLWPSQSPMWFYPMISLVLLLPAGFLLTVERSRERATLVRVGAYGIIVGLLGAYVGYQAMPFGAVRIDGLSVTYAITLGIASFITLIFVQRQVTEALGYEPLFLFSWRNLVVGGLSLAFLGGVILMYLLWAALFNEIGIGFFKELFRKVWFVALLGALSFGSGVIVFRGLTDVVDSISRLLSGIIKLLLPFLLVMTVAFLVALPFTGLEILWSTNQGTLLLMVLTFILLLCLNAVYQTGAGSSPYPSWLHHAITGALFTLPVFSALSFYGLYARLDQYAWTVVRYWAFVVWLTLCLFSFGYVLAVIKRRAAWPTMMASVNSILGVFVIVVLLLSNSPVLDFRKLSLASQMHRLTSGAVSPADFDDQYLRAELARPGYLALQELTEQDPVLWARLKDGSDPLSETAGAQPGNLEARDLSRSASLPRQKNGALVLAPADLVLPTPVAVAINALMAAEADTSAYVLAVDFDQDGQTEYAALLFGPAGARQDGSYYFKEARGVWLRKALRRSRSSGVLEFDQIQQTQAVLEPARLSNLVLGPWVFKPD
ncbi:MAG: DUF4153 domain-containing protein [Gammaproteobacteria bacterium]|nr:DUF4153 domain-containing protein [Gammaproteobacteria bacterium]